MLFQVALEKGATCEVSTISENESSFEIEEIEGGRRKIRVFPSLSDLEGDEIGVERSEGSEFLVLDFLGDRFGLFEGFKGLLWVLQRECSRSNQGLGC